MSGGEPSSIKRFIRCAAGLPVRSEKGGMRMRMHARFSGVWPYYAVNLIIGGKLNASGALPQVET